MIGFADSSRHDPVRPHANRQSRIDEQERYTV